MFSPALAAILMIAVFAIVLFITGRIDHHVNELRRKG